MGKCLLVKLKGVVNNENLPIFNQSKIKIGRIENNMLIGGMDGAEIELVCSDGLSFSDGTKIKKIQKAEVVNLNFEGSGYLIINGKYNVTYLTLGAANAGGYNASQINYMPLRYINLLNSYDGDINDFYLTTLKEIFVPLDQLIHGDICKFASKNKELKALNMNTSNAGIFGNIENLGTCLKLENIDGFLTSLSGDAKTMCDIMVSNGRKEGTLKLLNLHQTTQVTWNGVKLAKNTTITFSDDGYSVS